MAGAGRPTTKQATMIHIKPPNLQVAAFRISGTSPYVQNKFSNKAMDEIKRTQEAGSTDRKGKKKEPKDFQAAYRGAMYQTQEGWRGIPASAFRAALISACRLCGFTMTLAKLSLFVVADGYDEEDGTPLVRITKGEPRYFEMPVRLEKGGCDIRPRPMWQLGWEANLQVRFDADQFTMADVANLLIRVGQQVGVGEGRPDSKKSCGMGWGLFEVASKEETE